MPFLSLCIPAYCHPEFVERLLQSVQIQEYRDFEVIVSDDSPDTRVEEVCRIFTKNFPIRYVHNSHPLGSPANWNLAISMAKGEWIKLIHADDWLATTDALQQFADAAGKHPEGAFIFSGFSKYQGETKFQAHVPGKREELKLKHSPLDLIAHNFIGHPSVTLIPNRKAESYDEKVKWVVDLEYYLRQLNTLVPVAIPAALINIGVHPGQVTQQSIRRPEIELPEHLYLIQKLGTAILKNIRVYDHYWRLFRNLGFRSIEDAEKFANGNAIPAELKKMWTVEARFPPWMLRLGPVSKVVMGWSYVFNR